MWNDLLSNWQQFAAAFALFFFVPLLLIAMGAKEKGDKLTFKDVREIFSGAAAIVVVFIFLSSGRGCSSSSDIESDCRPSGAGIHNEC